MKNTTKILLGFVALVIVVAIVGLIYNYWTSRGIVGIKRTLSSNISDFIVLGNNSVITKDKSGVIKNTSSNSELNNAGQGSVELGQENYSIRNPSDKSFSIYSYNNSSALKKVVASQLNLGPSSEYVYMQFSKDTATDYLTPPAKLFSAKLGSSDTLITTQNASAVYTLQNSKLFYIQQANPASSDQLLMTYNITTKGIETGQLIGFALSRYYGQYLLLSSGDNSTFRGLLIVNNGQTNTVKQPISVNMVVSASTNTLTYLQKSTEDLYEIIELEISSSKTTIVEKIKTNKNIIKAQLKNNTYYLLTSDGDLLEAVR